MATICTFRRRNLSVNSQVSHTHAATTSPLRMQSNTCRKRPLICPLCFLLLTLLSTARTPVGTLVFIVYFMTSIVIRGSGRKITTATLAIRPAGPAEVPGLAVHWPIWRSTVSWRSYSAHCGPSPPLSGHGLVGPQSAASSSNPGMLPGCAFVAVDSSGSCCLAHSTFADCGPRVNYAVGKTAIVLPFRGQGAEALQRTFFSREHDPAIVAATSTHVASVKVKVAPCYKHLGEYGNEPSR